MYPKCFFGVEGEYMKMLLSNPQNAQPCMSPGVNTRLLEYRMSKSVQRPKRYVCGKICVQRKQEKFSRKLALVRYWPNVARGQITMVDVITCAIYGDCRLGGVGVARGVTLPSPIDLRHRSYNIGHTTAWPRESFEYAR